MTALPTPITTDLFDYILSVSPPEHPMLQKIREDIEATQTIQMEISTDLVHFLQLLIKLTGTSSIIEVGTFVGYSALAMALALPENGRLLTLELYDTFADRARAFWDASDVGHKIDIIVAPATLTLNHLLDQQQHGMFDLAFIDANKADYDFYYEACLKLIRPNGLIAIDNTLWNGQVADETATRKSTVLLRKFNEKLSADTRIDLSLLTIGDGLTLCRKK